VKLKVSTVQKYRIVQYTVFVLIGLFVGATFLSAVDVQTAWEMDTYASGLRVDTKSVVSSEGVVVQLDPDGTGVTTNNLGQPIVVSLKPTVVMEFGGLRHVDKDGMVTDWAVSDREYEESDRDHYIHYFEFDVVARTVAHERDAMLAVPPLGLLTLFPYIEHEKVMAYPQIRIMIQPELGNETFHAVWGNAYVVATTPILYNIAMKDHVYAGYWDATPQIQQPSLNSKCAVVQTISNTLQVKDYVVETWCGLEAGVEYKYSNPLVPTAISGISGIQNVGLIVTVRFSFDLSRPVRVEQQDTVTGNPDVAPIAHSIIDSGFLPIIVGVLVVLLVVVVYVNRKLKKFRHISRMVV
jgi:hypothetical protein